MRYAFDWRIEAGQQHRLNYQESQRVSLCRVGVDQGLLEGLDQLLMCRAVRPRLPGGIVVVAAGDDGRGCSR